jgi:hypothetical protein
MTGDDCYSMVSSISEALCLDVNLLKNLYKPRAGDRRIV